MDLVTLKQLRSLSAIEAAGSLTGAAALLNVTVPAVSAQLRLLEENVKATLLMRGPNGKTSLTREGEVVLSSIQSIEKTLSNCIDKVTSFRAGTAGRVAIGVVSTGKYFAPALLVHAQNALPDIEFSLKIGNRNEIRQALIDETIDVAIMGRAPQEPPVEAIRLGEHPYVLIAKPRHRLAGLRQVSQDELAKETFLCRESGSGTRLLTERFIDEIGEGFAVKKIEMGTNETIKQGVMAGLGVALISGHTVAQELQTGHLTMLSAPGLPIFRSWFMIRRLENEGNPASLKFQKFLEAELGNLLPELLPL